jgi:methyl-accepting chemotaxis protein
MTRTNAKAMLIDALNADFLPKGFAEFLDVELPEFDYGEMDSEESFVWEGKLARHLCTIFTLFEGLFLLEIPLRIGQKNATMQGMLLAALQATRTVGAYYSGEVGAAAQALNAKMESVTPVDGKVTLDSGFFAQLRAAAAEVVAAIKQSADALGETADAVLDTAEALADGLGAIATDPVETAIEIEEGAWRILKSVSRAIVAMLEV